MKRLHDWMKNARWSWPLMGLIWTGCQNLPETTSPRPSSLPPAPETARTPIKDLEPRISPRYLETTSSGEMPRWKELAQERIDRHRKSLLAIRVLDENGLPVENATVRLTQKSHAFRFGQHLPLLSPEADPAELPALYPGCNSVTLEEDLRWSRWAFGDPVRMEEQLSGRLDALHQAGLRIRAGALVWPGWDRPNPPELRELSPNELARRIRERIERLVSLGGQRVSDWDVVNNPLRDQDFQQKLGPLALGDWFRIAAATQPGVGLHLNTANLPSTPLQVEALGEMITRLKQTGVPLKGVGIQAHFAHVLPDPATLVDVFSQFGTLHLPVEISALSSGIQDEATASAFARDIVFLAFAEPSVHGITAWGSSSSAISKALGELAGTTWNSTQNLTTNKEGAADLRAFHGHYLVSVQAGDIVHSREVDLGARGAVLHFQAPKSPKSPGPFRKTNPKPSADALPSGPINLDAQPPAPPPPDR